MAQPPLPPPQARRMQPQHANGGAPHSRPGTAAALLAGLANRLSRAFAAGDVPPQLAADLGRVFPGAASIR